MKGIRAVLCGVVCLASIVHAESQQIQLQKRPDASQSSRPAPPAPLVAPTMLEPAKQPNANVFYQALRQRAAAGESFKVKDVTLHRDTGELSLTDGTVTLYGAVNGRVTGAVFAGQGILHIVPPSAMERRQLKLLMKAEVLDQPFTTAVLAFTDETAAELKAASAGPAPGASGMGPGTEMQTLFRKDLHYDLEERLLDDVALGKPGGFFLADLKGPMFSKRLLYFVDPHGAYGVAPEEVGLLTSADGSYDITLGYGSDAQRKRPRALENMTFAIKQQTIDLQIEHNGHMQAKATALITANEDGVEVLPLELFPTLRVSGVWGPKGEALDFIQEDKERDPDFAVLLPKPLARGESIAITTAYAGKDVVEDLGNGNYVINGGARESWYPNVRGAFGNYAHYRITFHTPKDIEVVATGDRVRDVQDGKLRLSEWQTVAPIPVAGFNLGTFKTQHSEHNPNLQVASYANANTSDRVSSLANSGRIIGGAMTTSGMLERATSEGDAAIQIYTEEFGPLEYTHLALTQQSACNYGQSWPMLVYLPICYFWDSTIQHQLGLLDHDPTYWKVVTPHEIAHQWWGQTVGFSSYRDQWMSEGFADFSASLFLARTNKDRKPYSDFWAEEKRRLLEKNANGMRPVDVGPVVMGTRASSSRAGGSVYQSLIYPKGAYILHMLSMLFWTPQYKDEPFKKAMHDFVDTYRDRSATTEDFKAAMEKDMPSWLDLDHNHKLDWFFDAFVYGTEVPTYTVTSAMTPKGDGTTVGHFKLAQSGVSDTFHMAIPLYLEFENKQVIFVGLVTLTGTNAVEKDVPIGKMPSVPKRFLVNYNYDILSAN